MVQSNYRIVVTALLMLSLAGCAHRDEKLPEGHESASVTSPDGLSRAFVWMPETSTTLGATTSIPYQVWIQYLQGNHAPQLLLKAADTDGIKVTWTSATRLEICYGPTHIYYFHNYFEYGEEQSRKLYQIEVLLKRAEKLVAC